MKTFLRITFLLWGITVCLDSNPEKKSENAILDDSQKSPIYVREMTYLTMGENRERLDQPKNPF